MKITLRDELAARAMDLVWASSDLAGWWDQGEQRITEEALEKFAKESYRVADAMLKARGDQ